MSVAGPSRTAALALLGLLVVPDSLFAQSNFKDMVTFGDSLTHNDLLGLVYGNPQAMYGADPNEAVWDKGAVSGDELTSYAIAGSESGDIQFQIDLFNLWRTLGQQDRPTLFGYEIGGNDILNNIDALANNAPGVDPNVDAIINKAIGNIRTTVRRLALSYPNAQWIIWTIPDVTYTPDLYGGLNSTQIASVRAHIQRVNTQIRTVNRYRNFVVADVYSDMPVFIENPPVLRGVQLQTTPVFGEFDGLFADEIHPTAVGNGLIANGIIVDLNAKLGDDIPEYTEDELADLAHIP